MDWMIAAETTIGNATAVRGRHGMDYDAPSGERREPLQRMQRFEADVLAAPPRPPKPLDVVLAAAKCTGVGIDEIRGKGRSMEVVEARVLSASALRTWTRLSFPEIAALLGQTNHSTSFAAVQRWRVRSEVERRASLERVWEAMETH